MKGKRVDVTIGKLVVRLEKTDIVDFIAEEFDSDRVGIGGIVNVQDSASFCKLTAFPDAIAREIADGGYSFDDFCYIEKLAFFEFQNIFIIFFL